ncbi:MAG: lipopolysaccharide heptosyltransferase II [Candidatus Zixiibacteriota bacterium]
MSENIVIRVPNHLGDAVMGLSMVAETREAWHGSRVTVLSPAGFADLFESNPSVDDIIPIPGDSLHGIGSVFRIKALVAPGKFTLGIVMPPSFGSASSLVLAGIPERIGYATDGRRLLLSKPILLPEPVNSVHRSELYFNLLLRVSGKSLTYYQPCLMVNDRDIENAFERLPETKGLVANNFVAVSFRARADSRRWGAENYTALCRRIASEYGYPVVLLGGKDDMREGDQIASGVGDGKAINMSGKTTVRQTAALMSRAKLVVGDDSGPIHLAAAVGTMVITINGAGDPKETEPATSRKRMIVLSHHPCVPCVRNACPLKGNEYLRCIRDVTVDMLFEAFKSGHEEVEAGGKR